MKRVVPLLTALSLMSACQLNFSSVGTWSMEASPPVPITTNALVLLADGRLALFGGFDLSTGLPTGHVLLFDPVRRAWSEGAPMPAALGFGGVVVPLHDGRVLLTGWQGANGISGETWLYDSVHNAWSRAGSIQTPRNQPSVAVLTDGRVLVAGGSVPLAQPIQLDNGQTINEKPVASAEIFDPPTRTWSPAGQLKAARSSITLLAVPHGGALAAGGCTGHGFIGPIQQGGTGTPFSTAELFDPQSAAWKPTTSLPAPRCGASGVTLPDGRAFLVGGDQGSTTTAVIFDPMSHRWTAAGDVAVSASSPVLLADGRILLASVQAGQQQGRVTTAYVGGQVFDPASGAWNFTTTTSLPVSSLFLQQGGTALAVALPDGDAIVLLETVALAFHPATSPPAGQVLDSAGLTVLLVALAAVLGLILAIGYWRGRRPRDLAAG